PAQVNESADQIEESLAALKPKTREQLIELSRERPVVQRPFDRLRIHRRVSSSGGGEDSSRSTVVSTLRSGRTITIVCEAGCGAGCLLKYSCNFFHRSAPRPDPAAVAKPFSKAITTFGGD